MALNSLFVLKLSLNPNQPTNLFWCNVILLITYAMLIIATNEMPVRHFQQLQSHELCIFMCVLVSVNCNLLWLKKSNSWLDTSCSFLRLWCQLLNGVYWLLQISKFLVCELFGSMCILIKAKNLYVSRF